MNKLDPASFLARQADTQIWDVRSPAEYAAGHVPGAVSMPLFSDDERAQVGICYKRKGAPLAVELGLDLVGPKMGGWVRQARQAVGTGGAIALYCWRGGMRSGSMAWLLEQAGFEVTLLQGGYKAYRHYVRAVLERPWHLRILGGYTGSGKTELLKHLAMAGAQVIDLEGLARHKGSAFGAIGQPEAQPRIEHFENLLANELLAQDAGKPVWVEDESQTIGQVFLYKPFYALMEAAPLYCLQVPLADRVARLVADYAQGPEDDLAAAIQKIARRMGPQHAQTALAALHAGDFAAVAELALAYYDPCYDHALARRQCSPLAFIPYHTGEETIAAEALLDAAANTLTTP